MTIQAPMTIDVENVAMPVCSRAALNKLPNGKLVEVLHAQKACHDCNWKYRPDAWLDGSSDTGIRKNCRLASVWLQLMRV